MPLTAFLSNESQGSGSSVVYAAKPTNSTSWADESEDLPVHGTFLAILYKSMSHNCIFVFIYL
jgi:hypothetical protein